MSLGRPRVSTSYELGGSQGLAQGFEIRSLYNAGSMLPVASSQGHAVRQDATNSPTTCRPQRQLQPEKTGF